MTSGVPVIAFPPGAGSDELCTLYRTLLESWNNYDAAAYAGLFATDGVMIGFDGSTVVGPGNIKSHLSDIFGDHQPARYVAKVREIKRFPPNTAMLRADVGMVPPGASQLEPATNAIQTLLCVANDAQLRIQLFQNTPAAFHGRPDATRRFTDELAQVLKHPASPGEAG